MKPYKKWWPPSPKVYVPFVAGMAYAAIHFAATGEFDKTSAEAVALTAVYGTIGYSVPHKAARVAESATEPLEDIGPDRRAEKTAPPTTD